jgi:tRNA (guanine6-N2)-methyltransferase
MARRRPEPELPACYAMVIPGLETLAGEEIGDRLGAEVKRTGLGFVVFRTPHIDRGLLRLRTTEDVFLMAWGTDDLTYRAEDLDRIRRWTDRDAPWEQLLRVHHTIRPKPKGKPTFRLVVQMTGEHGYRRIDARKALARGLAGKLPPSWRHVEENASIEIWLTIHGATAVCGVRLSDATMRHRRYKMEHTPASLRPTVAAAMVRLAEIRPGLAVLDPMCGAGTILAESLMAAREISREPPPAESRDEEGAPRAAITGLAGDIELHALRAARANLSRLGPALLAQWDARRLPLADESIDRLVCNLPFGVKRAKPEDIPRLYRQTLPEFDRVLRPRGVAVLLLADVPALRNAIKNAPWKQTRQVRVRVLGQPATILVLRK